MAPLEKVFETTVTVGNPIHFAADKERSLMALLRDKHEGRCFKGAYILRVLRVLASSAVGIVRTNLSGEAAVDVRFLAQVEVFSMWDILVGVRIYQRTPILVGVAHSDRPRGPAPVPEGDAEGAPPPPAAPARRARKGDLEGAPRSARAAPAPATKAVVVLMAEKASESVAAGQLVAVRVVAAKHSPFQPQASVTGVLLVCDRVAPAFRLRGSLGGEAAVELAPMLAAVEGELRARAGCPRDALWFFEGLLYAFRGAPGPASGGPPPGGPRGEAKPPAQEGAEARLKAVQASPAPGQSLPSWEGVPPWEGPPPLGRPPAAEARNVLDIVRRAVSGENVPVSGVWSRTLDLYRSSPLARCAAAGAPDEGAAPGQHAPAVDSVPRAVFAEFLKNILDYLVAVRELTEVYATPELVASHANLWGAMRAAQRPPPE